jgi:hypothetical protein
MTQGPSPLRAPAEVWSEPVSTPTNHRNSRCNDCGAPLDVWKCCPNASADAARLGSSVLAPLYCGKPSKWPWQFGVDMPGVGRVPASYVEPQATRSVLRGSDRVTGEMPETLARQLRDEVFLKLAFAAKNLAERNCARSFSPFRGSIVSCGECGERQQSEGSCVVHSASCWTGRVRDLVAELQDANDLQPTNPRKEAAPAEAESRAEAGIPLCGDFGEPWTWAYEPVFGDTRIFDREGTVIAAIAKQDRESAEWASRIVDCVNTLAANPAWASVLVTEDGGAL